MKMKTNITNIISILTIFSLLVSTTQAHILIVSTKDDLILNTNTLTYNNLSNRQTSKTVEATYSIGTSGSSNVEGSMSGSKSTSGTKTHNNSTLNFNTLKLTSKDDTTIKGATIIAKDALVLDIGGSLDISSVQDTHYNSSQNMSVGSSGTVSASMSKSKTKQTVLTSLRGGVVQIDVKNNTNLKGALISAQDEDGTTNDNLTLNTNTLTTSNLSNTKTNRTISIGGSGGGSTVSANIAIVNKNSKTKTLSTITTGDINIANTKDSTDISKLNRDKDDINLDLYDVKSDVEVSVEVDTNLLTEQGRKKIKDDIITSSAITNAIEQIATTDKANVLNFFKETDKNVKVYEGIKKELAKNPQLAKQLQNPNLTPQQKQDMLQTIVSQESHIVIMIC